MRVKGQEGWSKVTDLNRLVINSDMYKVTKWRATGQEWHVEDLLVMSDWLRVSGEEWKVEQYDTILLLVINDKCTIWQNNIKLQQTERDFKQWNK